MKPKTKPKKAIYTASKDGPNNGFTFRFQGKRELFDKVVKIISDELDKEDEAAKPCKVCGGTGVVVTARASPDGGIDEQPCWECHDSESK